jgi:hypothetical protein
MTDLDKDQLIAAYREALDLIWHIAPLPTQSESERLTRIHHVAREALFRPDQKKWREGMTAFIGDRDAESWMPIETKTPWTPCEERGVYDHDGDGLFFFRATHWRPLSTLSLHNGGGQP